MALINLFFSFLRIGLFTLGAGYSFLPIIEREVVQRYQWLTKEEFLDVLGVANVFPGAISIKYAAYTGYKIAGILGAIVANIGNALGPAVLIIFAYSFCAKYSDLPSAKGAFNAIQLAVFAMIIAVAFQLINLNQLLQIKNLLIVVLSFLLFTCTKVHPAIIIISAAVSGAVLK